MVLTEVEIEDDEIGEEVGKVCHETEDGQTVQLPVEAQTRQQGKQHHQPRTPREEETRECSLETIFNSTGYMQVIDNQGWFFIGLNYFNAIKLIRIKFN